MQLGSNFRLSSIGLNSGRCDWLGLRHQSRVCTENLQLTGAKSPPPKFGGMRRNSPDISKGLSLSGMWGFDPWMVSQAVRPSCRYPEGCQKGPPTAGFWIWPPVSRLPFRLFGGPNRRKSPAVFENIPVFRRLRPETWFERHCPARAAVMPGIPPYFA